VKPVIKLHRKLGTVSREHVSGTGCSVNKLLEVCQDIMALFVKFGIGKEVGKLSLENCL